MEESQYNDYSPNDGEKIFCVSCSLVLEVKKVTLSYMDGSFPVDLLCCPKCGFVYIPEDLAVGKMLRVEKALEDK